MPQDGDEALDVYDARVDGGFSPLSPSPCEGEACRPPVSPVPAIYDAPPSATFTGAGNVSPPASVAIKPKSKSKPAKCKTGFTKKHGKCVKRKSKKAKATKAGDGRRDKS